MNTEELHHQMSECYKLGAEIDSTAEYAAEISKYNSERLGPSLRRLRIHKGIKQCDMSKQLGVCQSYLSDLERGIRMWNLERVKNYLELIDNTLFEQI